MRKWGSRTGGAPVLGGRQRWPKSAQQRAAALDGWIDKRACELRVGWALAAASMLEAGKRRRDAGETWGWDRAAAAEDALRLLGKPAQPTFNIGVAISRVTHVHTRLLEGRIHSLYINLHVTLMRHISSTCRLSCYTLAGTSQ